MKWMLPLLMFLLLLPNDSKADVPSSWPNDVSSIMRLTIGCHPS